MNKNSLCSLKIKSNAHICLIPVFPIISSQGLSATILICKGVISGIKDQSLTVESREQDAIVKGRRGWHVKPGGEKHLILTKVSIRKILLSWALQKQKWHSEECG